MAFLWSVGRFSRTAFKILTTARESDEGKISTIEFNQSSENIYTYKCHSRWSFTHCEENKWHRPQPIIRQKQPFICIFSLMELNCCDPGVHPRQMVGVLLWRQFNELTYCLEAFISPHSVFQFWLFIRLHNIAAGTLLCLLFLLSTSLPSPTISWNQIINCNSYQSSRTFATCTVPASFDPF